MRRVSEKDYQVGSHVGHVCAAAQSVQFGNKDLSVTSREEPSIIMGVSEMPREMIQRRKPCGCHPIWGFLMKKLPSKDAENTGGDPGQGLVMGRRGFWKGGGSLQSRQPEGKDLTKITGKLENWKIPIFLPASVERLEWNPVQRGATEGLGSEEEAAG